MMAKGPVTLKWTTRGLEALKVAARADFTDPDTKGLVLRVTPNGSKTWALLYRRKSDSKKRRVKIGDFPEIGLSAAREKAAALRVNINNRLDPANDAAEIRKADTVNELLDLYLEKHPRPEADWTKECKRIFNKDVRPAIGAIKLPDLKRPHIRQVIHRVEERGATTTVNRTLAALRRAFSWSVEKDYLALNPALNLGTDIEEGTKDRALTVEEILKFWTCLEKAPMGFRSRVALRLILITGQRPGEVCSARKDEVDLAAGLWTIPAKKTKNRQAHAVPLSDLAKEQFRLAISEAGDRDFVFPSRPRKGREQKITVAMQAHALSHAMRGALEHFGLKDNPATPHDLRRTVATHMARIGIADRHVGRVLNHGTELRRTITQRVYITHDFMPEKKQALEAWARELDRIVNGTATTETIIALRPSAWPVENP